MTTDKTLENIKWRAENDPLFAAEGLDIENARASVEELEQSVNLIEKILRKKLIYRLFLFRYPAAETAHPIRFLKEFVVAEELRRQFLKNPNREKASQLIKQWGKTAAAYLENAEAYQEAILALQKMEGPRDGQTIGYFDSAPTFSQYMEKISLLAENGRRLKSEVDDLDKILAGENIAMTPDDRSPKPGIGAAYPPKGIKIPPELRKLIKIASMEGRAEEKYGPLIYKLGIFNEGVVAPRMFFVHIGRTRGVRSRQIEIFLGDDFYFLNLKRGHFLDQVIYRPLVEEGLEYWCQPTTSFYVTLDLGYQIDIATFVDLGRRKFRNREGVLRQKSSLFDLLVGRGVHYDKRFAELLAIFHYHKKMPPLSFFYLARSYPTLYFLVHNKSVWRLNENLSFETTRFGKKSHYENLDELKKKLRPDIIEKIVRISSQRMSYFKEELEILDQLK